MLNGTQNLGHPPPCVHDTEHPGVGHGNLQTGPLSHIANSTHPEGSHETKVTKKVKSDKCAKKGSREGGGSHLWDSPMESRYSRDELPSQMWMPCDVWAGW